MRLITGIMMAALTLGGIAGGCSDDDVTATADKGVATADKGAANQDKGAATNDKGAATDDKGAVADKAQAPDQKAATPDTGTATKKDGAAAGSWTLMAETTFGLLVGCKASDPKKDCGGDFYLAVYDKQFNPLNPGKAIAEKQIKNTKKGVKFTVTGLPVGPKLWLAGFIDDDDNVNITSPGPDSGDPVFYTTAPFAAKAGQTITRKLNFQIRNP